jgi:hypothetical protein
MWFWAQRKIFHERVFNFKHFPSKDSKKDAARELIRKFKKPDGRKRVAFAGNQRKNKVPIEGLTTKSIGKFVSKIGCLKPGLLFEGVEN